MLLKHWSLYFTLSVISGLLIVFILIHNGEASKQDSHSSILQVRIANPPNIHLDKILYFSLLKLALEKSGRPYHIQINQVSDSPTMARIMTSPELANVVWFGTSREMEKQLLPVRIPLLRGLLGYRVFLIKKERQPLFNSIKTITDLAKFNALMGNNWADTDILEHYKLPVIEGKYPSLMPMLAANRGDYFPRSILEINQELDTTQYPDIGVEQSILLYYPLVIYFFVSPDNHALHDAIQHGLEQAMADGSYQKLITTHPLTRDVLKNLNLLERRLIKIDNPFLTDETRAALLKNSVDLKTLLNKEVIEIP